VRNPGIQFKVWVLMIGTAVIACFLAFELYLYDVATRQIVIHANTPSWSDVYMLWIAMNLPIVVVPILVAFAYFHNQKCDEVDRHADVDEDR
jgi:TRAP-type C4-dicarboxylate transport system permease small subunit